MSSDASRQVASPRLDPQFHHNATSPIAPGVTTPVSADTSQKPDEFPFPQTSQPADKMPFAVDVPGSNSPPPPHPPSSAAAPGSASPSGSPLLLKDVIHLFHCQLCDTLFTEPVTLPCGRTICKRCIPPAHVRSRISYPAVDDRLEGFRCPFKSCAKEHTLGDCGIDVTLNKLAGHIRKAMNMRGPTAAAAAAVAAPTTVVASQPTHGTTPSQIHSPASTLLSQSMPADPGHRPGDTENRHTHHQSHKKQTATGNEPAKQSHDDDDDDAEKASSPLARAQQLTRSELDCQVCYALYHDPLTTGCGHTFCRSCLHRILDHSRYCPICRRRLSISPLLNRASCPSNASLARIIETLWADELAARKVTIEADEAARRRDLETPLFICTLAFPQMPTFLHVFEPRYRLLVRRALEGDKTFGMVLPRRPRHAGDAAFHELGTLLRIENAQFFPDGRCLIETVGLSRFRVVRHGALDGYAVSSVERIDDISLEEEEATEAAEMAAAAAADAAPFPFPTSPDDDDDKNDNGHASATAASDHDSGDGGGGRRASRTTTSTTSPPPPPITVPSLETMTTHDLMQLATDFVRRMRDQSVPWMTDRMLAIYGECPVQDPSVFPWWLGSVLPVKDAEKYRLLGSASVRERLKICCRWIIEWETKTWYATSISSSSSGGVSRVGGGDGRAA